MAKRRNPTAAIPVELRSALAGRPTVGDWDVMFPWLTIDDAGFPARVPARSTYCAFNAVCGPKR